MNVRAPGWDDLDEVARLIAICDEADIGRADMTVGDLRRDWRDPGRDLERDGWVVELDGTLAGYGWLWSQDRRPPKCFGLVLPEARGRGVGSELVRRMESRAIELGARLITNVGVGRPAAEFLEARGYDLARHSYRMACELEAPPEVTPLPSGVAVRPFVPGRDDRALHAAQLDAFADDPDVASEPFERWRERRVSDPNLDPDLWLIARDGDDLSGFSLASLAASEGYVEMLGVRSPWRRRGLGLALLTRSFAGLFARGARRVALHVDAESPTNPVRLYERAGMHVAFRIDHYEKALS